MVPQSVRNKIKTKMGLVLFEKEDSYNLFQNPLYALYETSIECQDCTKHGLAPTRGLEHHLDINVDIVKRNSFDVPHLMDMVESMFKPETIEGYRCIKCNLRGYMTQYLPV